MPGTRLGSYEIVSLLGSGGMGEVYRATDIRLQRDVAIKVLRTSGGDDGRNQLQREARAAAALNHPHICTIYEIAEDDHHLFMVMEHIDGRPLSTITTEPLSPSAVVRYGSQVADALTHAHERGVIHRDLKSANLMLTADGRMKVLDFGIATFGGGAATLAATRVATTPGVIAGTTGYMAPEILKGSSADRRSDIWALGVVLYEMACGRQPFAGASSFEVATAILRDDPEPLPRRVGAPLGAIIARCLAKEPALRYQHASEVRAALEAIAVGAPAGSGTSPRRGRTRARSTTPAREATIRARSRPRLDTGSLDADVVTPRAFPFAAPAQRAVSDKSVIVLPFANLSPDADDAYFSDGLTDELITDLSRVAGLRVVPAAAAFRLKAASTDLGAIARDFKVDYVVEGRVRKAGGAVRITAQLVDISNNRTVWADKYMGALGAVFELQERVSSSIAAALQLRLRSADHAPEPAALEAFLKGRHFARQMTSIGFTKAIELFTTATELDPSYAAAFAALAEVHVSITTGWATLAARDHMPKAQAAVDRALQLDPDLAEAHMVHGLVAMYFRWDRRAAEDAFKTALRLNPHYADAHRSYAALLIWLDTRYAEALDHAERAALLDPLDLWALAQVSWVHYFSRDYDRAISRGREVVEANPSFGFAHYVLGCALLTAGQTAEAMQRFARAIELDGRSSHNVALLGMAHAIGGDQDRALECLAELDALEQAERDVATWKLHLYAALGDHDRVLDCLERAIERRTTSCVFLLTHPYTDPVRRDPRFVALVQRMGLVELSTRSFAPEWKPPVLVARSQRV